MARMLDVVEQLSWNPRDGENIADVVVRRVDEVEKREGAGVPDSDRAVACGG